MKVPLEKPGTPQDLVHFGVKGMRWGIRNEKESSGGKSDSPGRITAWRLQNAKKHEDLAAKDQAMIDDIKAHPSKNIYIQARRDHQVKNLKNSRNQNLKDAKDLRAGHLTDFQKKALIGAGVTAAVLVTYGAVKYTDSGQLHALLNRNTPFKRNDRLARKMTSDQLMKEVVSGINPDYMSLDNPRGMMGSMMNCRRCTFSYEMRRRGYDVKATHSILASGQTIAGVLNAIDPRSHLQTGSLGMLFDSAKPREGAPLRKAFKTTQLGKNKIYKIDETSMGKLYGQMGGHGRSANIFRILSNNEEGARGELCVRWNTLGAHSMAWEVIGGKAHIFDTQTHQHYRNPHEFASVAENIAEVASTRLDNVDLNEGFLARWVQNA